MKNITKLLLALAALATTLPAVGQLRIPNFGSNDGGNEQPSLQSSPNPFRLPNYDTQRSNKPYSSQPDGQRHESGDSPTQRHYLPDNSYGDSSATGTRADDNSSVRNDRKPQ
ncbi:MAG: hypothetical protein ABI155_08395 [Paralcaligenes sp.]